MKNINETIKHYEQLQFKLSNKERFDKNVLYMKNNEIMFVYVCEDNLNRIDLDRRVKDAFSNYHYLTPDKYMMNILVHSINPFKKQILLNGVILGTYEIRGKKGEKYIKGTAYSPNKFNLAISDRPFNVYTVSISNEIVFVEIGDEKYYNVLKSYKENPIYEIRNSLYHNSPTVRIDCYPCSSLEKSNQLKNKLIEKHNPRLQSNE